MKRMSRELATVEALKESVMTYFWTKPQRNSDSIIDIDLEDLDFVDMDTVP